MARRRFLARLAAWPLAAALLTLAYETKPASRLKIVMKSAWGSADPTKAAFLLARRSCSCAERWRRPSLLSGGPEYRSCWRK
jgi:hypothetical protein